MLGGFGRVVVVKSIDGACAAAPTPTSGEPAAGTKLVGAAVNIGFAVT